MTTWLVVLGAAGCTYLLRISMVVALDGRSLPERFASRLHLAGPAVLAALVATALFASGGSIRPAPAGHLLAVAAAVVVVRRTGNAGHALLVGLPVAWVAAAAGIG